MSPPRPLPDRPNLEHVRKEAKSLLRQLRSADVSGQIRLADAQLIIAREYGFTSWPRLVHYFRDVERQQHAHRQLHGGRRTVDAQVRALLTPGAQQSLWAARGFAAYVPRLFGLGLDDVRTETVSEEEARLVVARMHGAPSWTVLLERLDGNARTQSGEWEVDPMRAAGDAIRSLDLSALERVVAAHPELLHPSDYDLATGHTLMWSALGAERSHGRVAVQPIIDWLTAKGLNRQHELNLRLCGHIRVSVDEVQSLLDQGADPNWVAPSGIPVLEHALLRYWNRDAVDVIAARTTPRKALWIAAGLGDVNGVRSFLDRDGNPTAQARRLRPDFIAVGGPGFLPALPDADNEELLLEAMLVAVLNARTNVIEYMAARGAPIDSMLYGSSLVHIAVGNAMTTVVECLVKCGANLDLRSTSPEMTTRQLARYMLEQTPDNPARRRVAELCGINPDEGVAARHSPPEISASLKQALTFARVDAQQLGQRHVGTEHLLIGLLRSGGPPLYFLKDVGRMDVVRMRQSLADRLTPPQQTDVDAELPLDDSAGGALTSAIDDATRRRREEVSCLHLLHALMQDESGAAARLVAQYGVNTASLAAQLDRGL